MGDHVRKQIRDQIVTGLTGLTTTGTRVKKSRVRPVKTLPALAVYAAKEQDETVEIITMGGSDRILERITPVAIEGYAENEDQAELIAEEVEVAMAADLTINGLAKDSVITSTVFTYGDGDENGVIVTMVYMVKYQTKQNAPDVAL